MKVREDHRASHRTSLRNVTVFEIEFSTVPATIGHRQELAESYLVRRPYTSRRLSKVFSNGSGLISSLLFPPHVTAGAWEPTYGTQDVLASRRSTTPTDAFLPYLGYTLTWVVFN